MADEQTQSPTSADADKPEQKPKQKVKATKADGVPVKSGPYTFYVKG